MKQRVFLLVLAASMVFGSLLPIYAEETTDEPIAEEVSSEDTISEEPDSEDTENVEVEPGEEVVEVTEPETTEEADTVEEPDTTTESDDITEPELTETVETDVEEAELEEEPIDDEVMVVQTSFTKIPSSKIQVFMEYKAPEIITNQIYSFPANQPFNGAVTNVKYALKKGIKPDTKLIYHRALKINGEDYDITFHYDNATWGDDAYVVTFPMNFKTSNYGGGDYTLFPSRGLVPAIEYNTYNSIGFCTSGSNHAEIHVTIDITNSETGAHPNIQELAFAVADLDKAQEGFSYDGAGTLRAYTNNYYDGGITQRGSLFKSSFKTDAGDGNPQVNKRTVILQSEGISQGHFGITSQYDGDDGIHHLELGGIIFVGSSAEVKYFCDNGDHDLSSYDSGRYVGSEGTKIPYDSTATLQELYAAGYELVSDGYNNNKNFTGSHAVYEIHLKHTIEEVSEKAPAKRTIRYWFESVGNRTAATSVVQNVEFERYWKEDKVLKTIVGSKSWRPADTQLVLGVDSPREDTSTSSYGLDRTWYYDRPLVDRDNLSPYDDIVEDVVYYRARLILKNMQCTPIVGTFDIVDKATGEVVDTITSGPEFIPIKNLEYQKTYVIRQKTTEEPYVITINKEFTTDGSIDITIFNTTVKFEKYGPEEETTEQLAGASFEVVDQQGTVVTRFTTTGQTVLIPNLVENEVYTIREVDVPNSYIKSKDIKFTVGHEEATSCEIGQ